MFFLFGDTITGIKVDGSTWWPVQTSKITLERHKWSLNQIIVGACLLGTSGPWTKVTITPMLILTINRLSRRNIAFNLMKGSRNPKNGQIVIASFWTYNCKGRCQVEGSQRSMISPERLAPFCDPWMTLKWCHLAK